MRSSIRSASLVVALWLAVAPAPAAADGRGDASAEHRAARQRAASLTQRATRHYDRGRFDKALTLYGEAYEAYAAPELLFNIGQCHRGLGDDERALTFYTGYLRLRPEAANRALVEELIADAQARLGPRARSRFDARASAAAAAASEQSVGRSVVDPDRPREPAPLYQRWWVWAAALGVIATSATIYIAIDGDDDPAPRPLGRRD